MGQEEVKSSCSGSPQGLGKGLKLLKGLLVLVAKKDIDRFSFRAKRMIHRGSDVCVLLLFSSWRTVGLSFQYPAPGLNPDGA